MTGPAISSDPAARPLIVVFGAAVRPGGEPSPALQRRINYAAFAARRHPDADVFCSGAVGRHGPSEASVIARALDGVVAPGRLHLDEDSVDTLQTVRAATRFAQARDYACCLVCTDRYHQPRVRMLFALLGMKSRTIRFVPVEPRGTKPWLRMRLREAAALPYDLVAGLGAAFRDRWRG